MCCSDFVKPQGRWRVTCSDKLGARHSTVDSAVDPPAVPHARFFPPYRTPGHVTCPAAGELAASVVAVDALPQVPAHACQSVLITLDER